MKKGKTKKLLSFTLHLERKAWVKFISIVSIPVLIFFTLLFANAQDIEQENVRLVPPTLSNAATIRLQNIDLMRNVLKKNAYLGYDILIISSTSKEEAHYQQNFLEKAFAGTCKKDGKIPIILSVIDSIDGGQLIGSVYTWLKAEEMMRKKQPRLLGDSDLLSYVRLNNLKVAIYHNGGKGERFSPLTQSLGNSRGAQKLVGCILNAQEEEIELDILLSVILQCSSFAATNKGTHIDTFWTSQIAFGSKPHDGLIRSDFELDKFLVGFDKNNLIAHNLVDFGTAALSNEGRMTAFYGNKRFAFRKGNEYIIDGSKIEKELLSKGDSVAYDFGSFSTSLDMWGLLVEYWERKMSFESMPSKSIQSNLKRDIDPHFIQPFIRFLYGINDLADRNAIDKKLPCPATLVTQRELNAAREEFEFILNNTMPLAYSYIWTDANNEMDPKKKDEALACLNEVIEFYLLYRQSPPLENLQKVFGFIDLGDETQWFRYRRPIDIMNEKFEMLTDLIGMKIETELNGSIQEKEGHTKLFQRSLEARLMRGITDDKISKFAVEGKEVTLTFAEIEAGKVVEGVYIKNSIVQNSNLTKGSAVINSILNNVIGKVIAKYSYIESTTSPLIEASISVVHQVIDIKQIKAHREVVSDVYKSKITPCYHGRMRAPIGYDPKGMPIYKKAKNLNEGSLHFNEELDETIGYFIKQIPYSLMDIKEYSDKTARTEDGRFTFEEIREIRPRRMSDKDFRESLNSLAEKAVSESRIVSTQEH